MGSAVVVPMLSLAGLPWINFPVSECRARDFFFNFELVGFGYLSVEQRVGPGG